MDLMADPYIKSVLEFMQQRLPACKLVAVADCLPQMARLLWGHYAQEPCVAITLTAPKVPNPSPPTATESFPERLCVDDGSVAATGDR